MLGRPGSIPLILAPILCCSAVFAEESIFAHVVVAPGAVGIKAPAQTRVVRRVTEKQTLSFPSGICGQTKVRKRRKDGKSFRAACAEESNVSNLTAPHESKVAAQHSHIYLHERSRFGSSSSSKECKKYEKTPSSNLNSGSSLLGESKFSMWEGIYAAKGQLWLYGTGWAQDFIYNHQNPLDCTNKKFLIYEDHSENGLGSHIHVLGQAMKIAMDLNRILVFEETLAPQRQTFPNHYDKAHCPGAKSLECWFKPLSKCKPSAGSDVMRITEDETVIKMFKACLESKELCIAGQNELHQAPKVFMELLDSCSTIQPEKKFYWWRAQSATYITRLNNHTRQEMDKLRQEVLQVYHGATKQTESFYRLPPGTISAHVRHGDKWKESELHPSRDYLNVATMLANGAQDISVSPQGVAQNPAEKFKYNPRQFAGRSLWVATDDATVVEEFKKFATGLGDSQTWDIYFSNITREGRHIGAHKTVARKVLEILVDVELSLEADAFVVTLNSNFGRLVDELRMTTMRKASNPLVTVSVSCPPYGWKLKRNASAVEPCYLDY